MGEYPVSVTLEEGTAALLGVCRAVGTETIPVQRALGRVLASDITAPESIPPFPRSPYDGYALIAADIASASEAAPVTLEIIEEVPAGHAPQKRAERGKATKILTGAPIPEGADIVVKFEDTKFTEKSVTFFKSGKSGENVVPEGEDVKRGETVIARGSVVSPAYMGLAVGLGYSAVEVYRRPKAAIISTGDELVGVGEPLEPGKIRNSSAYTLAAYIGEFADAELCGTVPDDETAIADAVAAAAENADVIFTTGGVSVGDYDMIQRAMKKLGADVLFWKMKMKPGSSCLAGTYRGTPVLCLSGNPSAAAVTYFMAGMPALKKLSGMGNYGNKEISVRLLDDFPKKSPNRRFLPGKLEIIEGQAYIALADRQGNGMLHPLHGCSIMGEIPAGSGEMRRGETIKAYDLFL